MMWGSIENRFGVFGSISEFAGNPPDKLAKPGTEQFWAALYDGRLHGATKLSLTKKGGLNPGLGLL